MTKERSLLTKQLLSLILESLIFAICGFQNFVSPALLLREFSTCLFFKWKL